jgi:hypothetical protein
LKKFNKYGLKNASKSYQRIERAASGNTVQLIGILGNRTWCRDSRSPFFDIGPGSLSGILLESLPKKNYL